MTRSAVPPTTPLARRGRLHAPALDVLVSPARGDRAERELRAPRPGIFVPWIAAGDLVRPGRAIGELVVLGRASALTVPRSGELAVTGIALELPPAEQPVGYGDILVAVDPSLEPSLALAAPAGAPGAALAAAPGHEGLVFRAPTSGRFYGRAAPDKPPFVTDGAELTPGTTICLLEVMKTFHRVTYGGPGLPDTARVRRVLVADGDDVNAGDPLLALA